MNIRLYVIFCVFFFQGIFSSEVESPIKTGWSFTTLGAIMNAPKGMKTAFKERIKKRFPVLTSSLHSASVARVESLNSVSQGEKKAIKKRMKHIEKALRARIGNFQKAPKIAIVASGGGLRASLATLGVLSGLEKTGLLDTVLWQSTLSGSTWPVGSWIQSALKESPLSVTDYAQQFVSRISNRYITSFRGAIKEISSLFLVNAAYDIPVTLVDLFGGLLSNVFFSNQTEKLSSQVAAMQKGIYPIPIYTAVSAEKNMPHYWYAYTPWDVAIEPVVKGEKGFSIPSWAFGRQFLNKKSTGYKPEKTFGFNLGTYGSAFAADLKTMYKATYLVEVENKIMRSLIDSIINRYGEFRFTAAQVFNFTKGMKHSPFKDVDILKIRDAALDFNFPYPPVSGLRKDRTPDILIFIDASRSVNASTQLKNVEKYARAKKLKFPQISYKEITQRPVSIFKDEEDASVPTLIYIPFIKNTKLIADKENEFPELKNLNLLNLSTCCGTTKGIAPRSGYYTPELAGQIMQLMEYNVRAYEKEIWEEIGLRAGTPGLYEKIISLLKNDK